MSSSTFSTSIYSSSVEVCVGWVGAVVGVGVGVTGVVTDGGVGMKDVGAASDE